MSTEVFVKLRPRTAVGESKRSMVADVARVCLRSGLKKAGRVAAQSSHWSIQSAN